MCKGNMWGGILLIAGMSIGAGMIGLPVQTAGGGLYSTLGFFLGVWLIMTMSAFLMLEACLWRTQETNLISMSRQLLGRFAAGLAWVLYLLLVYALLSAYTIGGMSMLSAVCGVPEWLGLLVFTAPFAYAVFQGAQRVDKINRWLMLGLILSYGVLVICAVGTSHVPMVTVEQPKILFWALPLAVTSFGYHIVIPSLKSYFHNHRRRLIGAIVWGSLLPLVIYSCWEWSILSVVPVDVLMAMLHQPGNPAELLIQALAKEHPMISVTVGFFAFFALVSSVIGVALALFDFLADGLRMPKTGFSRWGLLTLTFLPVMIIARLAPQGFLAALNYAGALVAILLILYPVAMVWSGRYVRKAWGSVHYILPGGKWALLSIAAFGILVIVVEVLQK